MLMCDEPELRARNQTFTRGAAFGFHYCCSLLAVVLCLLAVVLCLLSLLLNEKRITGAGRREASDFWIT